MTVGSAGVTLAAEVTGEEAAAKTLVLIHGGPGLSSEYMKPLEGLAGDELRVVRYDQRGMGGSSTPEPPSYHLDDYVADLDAVREAAGAEVVHLLGHSWGAWIAWAYLAAHPQRVASLIIACGLSPLPAANYRATLRLETHLAELQAQGVIPKPVPADEGDDCSARIVAAAPAYFHDVDAPVPAALLATQCRNSVFKATFQAVLMPPASFASAAAAYAGPCLVIFGQSDPLGVALGEASLQALTGSQPEMVIVPAAGHYPWLEGDDFAERVVEFLDSI